MAFDIIGAKNAGYSDTEIADFLSSQAGFDAKGARTAGYSDQEIIGHVSGSVDVGAEAPKPTRIFSTPSKGTQQDVMGIASPKDRQAAETAQVFVKNDIPAVAKTFGAKIGGGMEQSIGGAMRAYGEENSNRFNVDDSQLAQTRAGRYLNDLTAADDTQRAAIAQRGTELGNEGRAVIQAAQEDQPVQTRAGRILDQTAQSIGSNLPGMAATMVTGSPAVGLSMMGLQSFGQTYDESRAKGLNIADATMNAAIQGGTEVATEMLPFVALSKYLKTGNLSKEVLKHYLSDIPGEHLATAIQNASDAAYDTADMTPQQRIDAAADYLASNKHKEDQIDTFFTTVLQGAVMGGVAKAARAGNALAPAAQPAAQPVPSGPLSRAVGMADTRAVAPVQSIGSLVAERRGMVQQPAVAAQPIIEQPAPEIAPAEPVISRAAAPVQGIGGLVAERRKLAENQGNPNAQIPPVAGLSEPVDTSVSPISQGVAPISPTIGVSNETADEGRQDDRQYAQGTESNADGEGQGRDEAALQTVQRDGTTAQGETGVATAPKVEAPAPVQEKVLTREQLETKKMMLSDALELPDMPTKQRDRYRSELAKTDALLRGDKVSADVVYSREVTGNPLVDTGYHPVLNNMVPIKVSTAAEAERKLFKAHDLLSDMRGEIAKANYAAKIAKTATQKRAAAKKISELEGKGYSQESIDEIVNVVEPELQRLLKEATEKLPAKNETAQVDDTLHKSQEDPPTLAPAEPDFPLILSNLEKQTAVEKGKGNKGNWSVSDFQEYLKQSYPSVAGMPKVRILSALRTQAKGKPLSPVNQEVIDAFRHDEEALRQKYGTIEQVSQEIADEIDAEDYDSAADFFDAIIAKNEGRTDETRNAAEDNGEIEALFTGGAERDTQESQREVETTDDAGGWQQEVAVSAAKKVPTIGGVQKQGGRRQSTADLMDGFTPEPPSLFDAPKYALAHQETHNFKRWSNNAPLVTSAKALVHAFKSGEKVVVEAFHGTARPDRVGTKFLKKRATSGPMSFFTSNPELASGYAQGKQDTSLASEDTDYPNWFKYKPKGSRSTVGIDRAWHFLPSEIKQKISERMKDIRTDDDGNIIYEEGGGDIGSYEWELKQTRRGYDRVGNPLKAAVETWLMSGSLFNQEEGFMKVLELAGFPVEEIKYDPPHAAYPFVYKVYVAMQSPLVTDDIPQNVIDALHEAAKRDRTKAQRHGADMWDKNTRTLKDWVQEFDREENQYVWTSIPDKVTEVFKSLGYDGIIDVGGKGGGEKHKVYIPFEETQVKSAIGNKGTYDPTKNDIRYSTDEKGTADLTLERVQSSFPSLPVTEDNGTFTVTTPSGIPIRISKVGEIEFGPEQRAAAEKEYGRPLRPDERPAAEFKPLDHGAIINLTERGVSELSHESFHAAMNLALTERQKAAVLRTFGNEEKAAAEYQRLKESGALETRKGNYWLAKIYRFLRSLRQLISPTAKGVMEDVASGKVWGKAHAGDGGARYAAAWHGSPHDHDKFDSSKIGTGEGAQAYGWGLYFAGSKEVAEYYRDTLIPAGQVEWRGNSYNRYAPGFKDKLQDAYGPLAGTVAYDITRDFKNAEKALMAYHDGATGYKRPSDTGHTPETREVAELIAAALGDIKDAETSDGRLYQVELAPSEDEYLLWDKPLSEQSEEVKAALADEIEGMRQLYGGKSDPTRMTGAEFYKGLDGTPQEASEYLHSLGVRGIKYLDGTSRGAGEGNHNYVIFNDEDVEIKAKYSLRSAFTDHNPTALKSSLTVHPKVQALVGSVFNNGRNVSPWMRTVGTMYHMAEKLAAEGKPQFKAVFDKGQEFLTDVSTLALKAESLAPDIFPKMGTGKGLFHNLPRKDAIAIAEPLYQGTLFGGADPKKGKVFSDTELKRIFNLSDHQIELYKQARAATDQSLDDMAKSLIARNAKEAQVGFDREMDLADMAAEVKSAIQDKIDTMKTALDQLEEDFKNTPPDPDAKAQKKLDKAHNRAVSTQEAAIELHESFIANVENLAYKTDLLKKRGYFPLMRFGQYTVTMKDQSGKVEFFGLYESAYKARLMTDALDKENPGMTVVQSVMGREKFKLFAGMNLEGLQLFAEHMKAEDSEAYQEYLKQAMNNRSAMKRLIHRKGTEGFSEDAVRTLANFITSNARHAATQYHLHDMRKLASDVPEDTQGDVQDQAVKLYEYLSKPAEEASKLRGYLFFHYLGGSLASGIVNMTQPVMMTMPYLASKTTAAKAAKHLTKASKMSFTDPAKVGGELGVALRRAESEGVTAPQEIYQLTAMASNKLLAANPYWNAGMKAWGGFFSVAEAFNRRVTFIASFRISREKGLSPDRAYTEAVKAITETQGIYNKGNRPKWGRGTVGGTLFTFKQFSVMYLELFNRLPAKQKGIMLGILWIMAGLQGMPFAEDAEDIIDTIGQWAGFATNSKRWINQQAEDALGKDAGDFVTQGISSVLPLDLQGRMGLQNLIPGTGILKQSATDKGRDVKEFFGPAGGLLASLGDALTLAAQGLPGRAALAASPRAVQNIAQGVEMMATGAGHDKYGRKTVELSPGESAMKLTGFNPSRVAEEGQVKSANMQDVNLLRVRKNEISTQWAYGIAHKDSGEIAEAKRKLIEWNAKNPELKMNMGSVVQSARQKARALNTTGKDRFLKSMPKEIRRRVIDELG